LGQQKTNRLKDSYTVLKEILGMPDKGIPRELHAVYGHDGIR
jgi:hypothetical protein